MLKELSAELMDLLVVETGRLSVDGFALPADLPDWDVACSCCCCCCGCCGGGGGAGGGGIDE